MASFLDPSKLDASAIAKKKAEMPGGGAISNAVTNIAGNKPGGGGEAPPVVPGAFGDPGQTGGGAGGTGGDRTMVDKVVGRWAGNPEEGLLDRAAYRNADRVAGMAENIQGRAENQVERRQALGLSGDAAQAKADRWGDVPEKAKEWDWREARDNVNEVITDINERGKDRNNWQPYEEIYDEALDRMRGIDTSIEKSNFTNYLDPGKQSIAGDYYAGREKSALDRTQQMGAEGRAGDIAGQAGSAYDSLNKTGDPREQGILDNDMAAIQGKLTSPENEWFQNRKTLMDQNVQDSAQKIREMFGAQHGIGTGQFAKEMSSMVQKSTDQLNSMLSDQQLKTYEGARDTMLQNKGLNNAIMGMAADIAKTGNMTELEAQKMLMGHITNAANTQVSQLQTMLKEIGQNNQYGLAQGALELDIAKGIGGVGQAKTDQANIGQEQALAEEAGSGKWAEIGTNVLSKFLGNFAG